jgi:hypothetical protein
MIEGHDGVLMREAFDVIGEILLRTTVAVDKEQAGARTVDLHVELDTVIGPYPHVPTPVVDAPSSPLRVVARHLRPGSTPLVP